MRQILATGKEPHHRPPKLRNVVADRSAQHWMIRFDRVEHRTLGDGTLHLEFHFAINTRERAQMRWKDDTNHGNACTSTDKTAGRSRTIGFQLSPASADA